MGSRPLQLQCQCTRLCADAKRKCRTLEYALLDQLARLGPVLKLLLEAVGPHVAFQFALVGLKGRRGSGVGEDVACVLFAR